MRLLWAGAALLLACRPPESKPAAMPAETAVTDTKPTAMPAETAVTDTKPKVAGAQTTATDTLRGTLVLEGSDPFPIAVMQTSAGRVVVDGESAAMRKLSRLDLWMRGTRSSPTRFVVTDYRVRSVNGAKAWDGFLRSGPTGFRLEMDDGSFHQIRQAPATFSRFTRSRMWVTENPDGSIREYGVF